MSTRDSFGPNLRAARMRRGLSLQYIAEETKVAADLWQAMERNDFRRWPSGIYARAWVRAYAVFVGVDPIATVNEFCRWFPNGDRRAEPLLRGHAQIVDHRLAWHDDPQPPTGDRRAPRPVEPTPAADDAIVSSATGSVARTPEVNPRNRVVATPRVRLVAAMADLGAAALIALPLVTLVPATIWTLWASVAVVYQTVSLVCLGCSPSVWAIATYSASHPDLRIRADLFAFRRLASGDKPFALRRGATS